MIDRTFKRILERRGWRSPSGPGSPSAGMQVVELGMDQGWRRRGRTRAGIYTEWVSALSPGIA